MLWCRWGFPESYLLALTLSFHCGVGCCAHVNEFWTLLKLQTWACFKLTCPRPSNSFLSLIQWSIWFKCNGSSSDKSDWSVRCLGHVEQWVTLLKSSFLLITDSRCILMAFGTYEQTSELMSGRPLERKRLWNVQWTSDRWWSPWQEESWSILRWILYVILSFIVGLSVRVQT